MGIEVGLVRQHWNYFLALEDDIMRMSRYLEPTTANFSAFSLELARILITAASEVDVVAKLFCKKIDPDSKARDINTYRKTIVTACGRLPTATVLLPKFGLVLNPWEQWEKGKNPFWWRAYNDVKHHRDKHFSSANLHQALNAVSALYLLLVFFYRTEAVRGELMPDPVLFQPGVPFEVDFPAFGRQVTPYYFQGEQERKQKNRELVQNG